jgi:flagellar basal-body rod modification protein FlgD
MATAAAAIFQHQLTAGQALSPMDSSGSTSGSSGTSGTSSSDGSGSDSTTISANDFLTLLVTEMQNQDPTADTDPNEYINQLVQVNSLEQLIDINQTLSGALGSSSSSDPTTDSSDPSTQMVASSTAKTAQMSLGTSSVSNLGVAVTQNPSAMAAAAHNVHGPGGNLSVPAANAAAQRVGHALDGRVRASATRTQ